MNFSRFFSALIVLLAGCAGQTGESKPAADAPIVLPAANPEILEKPDAMQLKTAMADAVSYLVRVTQPSGEFVYLDSLDPNKKYKPVYNVVRHGGTMYALADYYSYKPEPQVRDALVRAADWLKKKYVKPIQNQKDMLAIWALPSDRAGDGPLEVKLGGVALGVVGLLGAEQAAPGTTPPATLHALGNCLLWLQEADGSFISKYDPAQGGKLDQWDSLYYPGEAALALAMLAEHDPDAKQKSRWLHGAFRALAYLARTRQDGRHVPPDHWALIATARLWPLHDGSNQIISKAALSRHAAQICEVIVHDAALRDVRTTPIATRLEGMLAALTFLPPEHAALRAKMQAEAERGVGFLLKTQSRREGDLKGAIPRAYTAPGAPTVEERAREVRIDYVQHALSAWLEYSRQNGVIPAAKATPRKTVQNR